MAGINRDLWLSALKAAIEAPLPESDALTTAEFGALVGFEHSHACRRLNEMVAQGSAARTKKQIRRADGGIIWVPAYRLVAPTQTGQDRTHKGKRR